LWVATHQAVLRSTRAGGHADWSACDVQEEVGVASPWRVAHHVGPRGGVARLPRCQFLQIIDVRA